MNSGPPYSGGSEEDWFQRPGESRHTTTRDGLPVVSAETCYSTKELLCRTLAKPGGLAQLVFDMNEEQPHLCRSMLRTLGAYESGHEVRAVVAGFLTAYESLRRQAAANQLSSST